MIGYIIVRWDGESYGQHSDPSVVYTDKRLVEADVAKLEGRNVFMEHYDYWELELPEPLLPVPAPDGWQIVAEQDGQLALVEASP